MYGLTKKQHAFLEYLKTFGEDNKPSYREMADDLGYVSPSNVHRLMYALVERGKIRLIPGAAASWKIIE